MELAMGLNVNPNTASSIAKIVGGVTELLQAATGGVGQPAQQPAAQTATAPVDQFQQGAAPAAPAGQTAPTQGAAQPAGDIGSKVQQLVQALTSVIQMLSQLLGGG